MDGWEASTKLPDPLKSELQAFIQTVDDGVLSLKFELTPEGRGFPKIADCRTGEVTNKAMAAARPNYSQAFIDERYSPHGGQWASVYGAGSYTDARHALYVLIGIARLHGRAIESSCWRQPTATSEARLRRPVAF